MKVRGPPSLVEETNFLVSHLRILIIPVPDGLLGSLENHHLKDQSSQLRIMKQICWGQETMIPF